LSVALPGAEDTEGPKRKPRKAAPRLLESAVQKAVLQVLKDAGVWHMRVNTGAVAIGQGSGRRFVRFSEKGAADILFRLPRGDLGVMAWTEIKRPGERPTAEQLAWLLAQQRGGAVAFWSDNAATFRDLLNCLLAGGRVWLGDEGQVHYKSED